MLKLQLRAVLFLLAYIFIFLVQPVYADNPAIGLDGLWKYSFSDSPSYLLKEFDDSKWANDTIQRKTIENSAEKQNRTVWFRKNFVIPSDYKGTDLMLYTGSLTNFEVYFNGHLVGRSLNSPKHYFCDWNRKNAYYIPTALIQYNQNNVLAIKTYCAFEYGSAEKLYFDTDKRVQEKVQFFNSFVVNSYMSLCFFLVGISIFFFIFYHKSQVSKKHFYFSLVCILIAIYYTNYFIYTLPISYSLYQKIVFTSLYLACFVFLPFLKEFLDVKIHKWEKIVFSLLAVISLLGAAFTQDLLQYSLFRTKYLLSVEITLVYYAFLCIKVFIVRKHSIIRLLIGTLLLTLFMGHDIYYSLKGEIPAIGFYLNGYVIIIFLINISVDMINEYNAMYIKSSTDGLTGLYNHSYFVNTLSELCSNNRDSLPYSLIIVDIDKFKLFNDKYGHLAGDYVLSSVSRTLKSSCCKNSIVARYGGEEFAILLKGYREDSALELAETLRRVIENQTYEYKGNCLGKVTISAGVISYPSVDLPCHPEVLIDKADEALYYSKEQGRNKVTHYNEIRTLEQTG